MIELTQSNNVHSPQSMLTYFSAIFWADFESQIEKQNAELLQLLRLCFCEATFYVGQVDVLYFNHLKAYARKAVRRPGIEPGSQEWESCMIPLHQRR